MFMPCAAHTWNLLLADIAKSSSIAQNFFGTIQRVYVLFAASTKRWQILKEHVQITVKPLCETRWESRVNSVRAIRFQIEGAYDALLDIHNTTNDANAKSEASSLAKSLKSYQFLVVLAIWYEILAQINLVSKMLQKQDMQLDQALQLMDSTRSFLTDFKQTGLITAKIAVQEMVEKLEMTPEETAFPQPGEIRPRRKRKQFDYEADDEVVRNPEDQFRVNFFIPLMDLSVMSIDERFAQMATFRKHFGFLSNMSELKECDDEMRMKLCENVHNLLSDQSAMDQHDLELLGLFTELKTLHHIIPDLTTPMKALEYIVSSGLYEAMPNVVIALRILLTIPVTVASGERSFSKLKLIKTYLRATMTQRRLVGLSFMAIENDIASGLDYTDIIDQFASIKSRKVHF